MILQDPPASIDDDEEPSPTFRMFETSDLSRIIALSAQCFPRIQKDKANRVNRSNMDHKSSARRQAIFIATLSQEGGALV